MLKKFSAENTDRKVQRGGGEKGAADSEEAAYKRAQESQKAYRRSATKESTKTSGALSRFPGLDMAKYLARSCPRCNCYVGIVMRDPGRNVPLQAVNGHCLGCGYRMSWIVD